MYTCMYTHRYIHYFHLNYKRALNICVVCIFSMHIFYIEKYLGSKYQRLHLFALCSSDPSAWLTCSINIYE